MVNKELSKQLFFIKWIRGGEITSLMKENLAAEMKVDTLSKPTKSGDRLNAEQGKQPKNHNWSM